MEYMMPMLTWAMQCLQVNVERSCAAKRDAHASHHNNSANNNRVATCATDDPSRQFTRMISLHKSCDAMLHAARFTMKLKLPSYGDGTSTTVVYLASTGACTSMMENSIRTQNYSQPTTFPAE